MKDICGTTGLACIKCNPGAWETMIKELHKYLLEHKLTIKATAGEKLIITDQATGEEYIVEDLGYPFQVAEPKEQAWREIGNAYGVEAQVAYKMYYYHKEKIESSH